MSVIVPGTRRESSTLTDLGGGVYEVGPVTPDGTTGTALLVWDGSADAEVELELRFGSGGVWQSGPTAYGVYEPGDLDEVRGRITVTAGTLTSATVAVYPLAKSLGARLYNRLPELYRDADERGTYELLRWLGTVLDQASDVDALVARFTPELNPAGDTSDLVDPQTADADWLTWLAQLVGVKNVGAIETVAARREAIGSASGGWRSGTRDAVADAARRVLTGDQYVEVYAFSDETQIGTAGEWDVLIVTRESETPDPTAVVPAVIEFGAKPAGVVLHHREYSATWDALEAAYPTWNDLEAAGSWNAIEQTGF